MKTAMNSKQKQNAMVRTALVGAVVAFAALFSPRIVQAGIPEPDLVWYGKVLTDSGGVSVRVTSGTLTWRIERISGGTPWTLSTQVTNINDQFSFVLRIPCETPEAGITGSSNTVFLTSPATAYGRATVTLDGQPLSLMSAPAQFALTPTGRGRPERIDLALGTLPVDTDGDGLGDAWEQQHFGGLSATASEDPDGDGLNNLREYRAGTNPTDANSVFEFIDINPILGGIHLRWSSQPNRHYRLRRATVLSANPASFQVIQTGLVATPPVNEFVDATDPGGTQFFYIVEVVE
jgi:hypothetical protein